MTFPRRQLLTYLGMGGLAAAAGVTAPAAAGTLLKPHQTQTPPCSGDPASGRFAGDPGLGKLYYGSSMQWGRSLEEWESRLPRNLGDKRSYYTASQIRGLVSRVSVDLNDGRLPFVSIKTPGSWASVASGDRDPWLHNLLDQVATQSGPVFLAIHHEPENDVSARGMRPEDWVAMQTRAVRKAKDRAPNVTIVPICMAWTFHPLCDRDPADWLVPEAQVFGFDVYNRWSPNNESRWRSFADGCDPILPWTDGKPLVVGEYGCRTDPENPGRAARWLRDAYAYALDHNVACLSYFNSGANSPEGTWQLDRERGDAFAELLDRPTSTRI